MGLPVGRRVAGLFVFALIAASCGGTSSPQATAAPTSRAPVLTTTFVPQAQVGSGSPAPKPTTTLAEVLTPDGFPTDLPLPAGEVGYYTGSPELGFHLNISTALGFSELVRFFTEGIESDDAWTISVRDVGQGYLDGFEGLWATYTAPDHVLTQLRGRYPGVIEIEGRHVNVLLDGPNQPAEGEEPAALPPPDVLPRPETLLVSARYSSGLVQTAYEGGADVYATLLDTYRSVGWIELGATDPDVPGGVAVGELGGWRVTIRDMAGTVELDFEDRSLSFP